MWRKRNGALASIQSTPLVYEEIHTLHIFNRALLSFKKTKTEKNPKTLYTRRGYQIEMGAMGEEEGKEQTVFKNALSLNSQAIPVHFLK